MNEANVGIWTTDLVGHNKVDPNKAKRMEGIVMKIHYSMMEMEMTQNGIIMYGFEEWENVICWPGERLLTCMIEIQNKFDYNILSKIKGDDATKQGFIKTGTCNS